MIPDPRRRLRLAASRILAAGLSAADPTRLVRATLAHKRGSLQVSGRRIPLRGRLALLAVGKAASTMAAAAEATLGPHLSTALAVDVAAPKVPLRHTRVRVAGHPVPDARSLEAAREAEELARGLGKDDVLLVLISGGGSALLAYPVPSVSLEAKGAVTSLLLRAGATIHELNAVRKHLSQLKGGGLARLAAPARVVTLALSDVVGDDLSTIASGPTEPDPTTYADALKVLKDRRIWSETPLSVRNHLEAGARGEVPETLKPGDPVFRNSTTVIVGSNSLSIEAAAQKARSLGYTPLILTTRLQGEAREVARVLVAILEECVRDRRPKGPPVCLLCGGETTVTVLGDGRGGRNQELAVAAAADLARFKRPSLLASLATDGQDGTSPAAGGVVDDQTLLRAEALGLAPPSAFLETSDSWSFLGPLGDLIVTGSTGTNVMDLTILLAS